MTILQSLTLLRTPLTTTTPTRTLTRTLSFRPRRTPPPSVSGVLLSPRGSPTASLQHTAPPPNTALAGGVSPDWKSPHHTDYYGKVDDSTLNHGHLLHGDPNMPIGRFTSGESKVRLGTDRLGRDVAKELDDYRFGKRDLVGGLLEDDNFDDEYEDEDELTREFGSSAAEAIRLHLYEQRMKLANGKIQSPLNELESQFRTIDRVTAASGSTQDLALMRRSKTESRDFYRLGSIPPLQSDGGSRNNGVEEEIGKARKYDAASQFSKNATVPYPYGKPLPSPTYHPDYPTGSGVGDNPNDPEEEPWFQELNKLIYEEEYNELGLGELEDNYHPVQVQQEEMDAYMKEKDRVKKYNLLDREDRSVMDREEKEDEILEMIKRGDDPNQEAFGPWGECTIKVDRVQKVERGGTTVRYRALVIGGNGNGAAGFGIGKALSPNEAIIKAGKHCKRNVFYVNRYLNTGLCYDLAGRHNSCRVALRAVRPDYGLHGHPLICEILQYAGITDCTSKSHGNRNPYNVVYATFKALMTHESLEDIAMKRGKKLLNLQRARRLGL
ncbi:hypothetical protein ACHAWO_008853 [Cyclotella atomus]|uniref:S5 DRBM domain-containing protein n=1 Tax=Cyclotella atomus TaxID=382360 RepID=A0ABD3QTU1_9STRA